MHNPAATPAATSSIITPQPLGSLSNRLIPNGFQISNSLKRPKASNKFNPLTGTPSMATQTPTNSSTTIRLGSWPHSGSSFCEATTPKKKKTRMATSNQCACGHPPENCPGQASLIPQSISTPTAAPAVPGATGE